MVIYLAGPLGFSEAGRSFHHGTLVPALKACGASVLDPWALSDSEAIRRANEMPLGEEKRDTWRKLNWEIGQNNVAAIDRCDLVFAVLDGTDVDSGTAAEIGYAYARGKPILGYRGDFRLASDNDGAIVNVQVEHFVRASGGEIICELRQLQGAIVRVGRATRRTPGVD